MLFIVMASVDIYSGEFVSILLICTWNIFVLSIILTEKKNTYNMIWHDRKHNIFIKKHLLQKRRMANLCVSVNSSSRAVRQYFYCLQQQQQQRDIYKRSMCDIVATGRPSRTRCSCFDTLFYEIYYKISDCIPSCSSLSLSLSLSL